LVLRCWIKGIGSEFFHLMSSIVSFVSSELIFVRRNRPAFSFPEIN
jgi:hypothetical protein